MYRFASSLCIIMHIKVKQTRQLRYLLALLGAQRLGWNDNKCGLVLVPPRQSSNDVPLMCASYCLLSGCQLVCFPHSNHYRYVPMFTLHLRLTSAVRVMHLFTQQWAAKKKQRMILKALGGRQLLLLADRRLWKLIDFEGDTSDKTKTKQDEEWLIAMVVNM